MVWWELLLAFLGAPIGFYVLWCIVDGLYFRDFYVHEPPK